MVKSCSAYNCTNRFDKNSNISFFRFPFQRPDIFLKWCAAMRRKDWFPTLSTCLCSEHFLPEDFEVSKSGSNKRFLKPDAVPSQFDFSPYIPKRARQENKKNLVQKKTQKNKPRNRRLIKKIKESFPSSRNNSLSEDSNEIKQNSSDRTVFNESDPMQLSNETDTDFEEEKPFSEINIDSLLSEFTTNTSSSNCSTEEIVFEQMKCMMFHYEKAKEKAQLYKEKWKESEKQVEALIKIINNLKEINSITDDM